MFSVGVFARKLADPAKQIAARKLIVAPAFRFFIGMSSKIIVCLLLPKCHVEDYPATGMLTTSDHWPTRSSPWW